MPLSLGLSLQGQMDASTWCAILEISLELLEMEPTLDLGTLYSEIHMLQNWPFYISNLK